MPRRDVIVVGASAGGVAALTSVVGGRHPLTAERYDAAAADAQRVPSVIREALHLARQEDGGREEASS